MSETVTLEVSEDAIRQAREVAARTQRRLEEVLVEWIDRYLAELPVDALSDEEVLALASRQMAPHEQAELHDLLADNREGPLPEERRARLDELMRIYRQGMVRKAEALKVAVERGLIPPLNRN
mgnify:CR=1 FL=1